MSEVNRWFHMRVQDELKANGWSARKLAANAGVSPSTFTRLGRGHGIALHMAVMIADALGKTLSDLIAPVECETCHDKPPAGFRCRSCGRETDQ